MAVAGLWMVAVPAAAVAQNADWTIHVLNAAEVDLSGMISKGIGAEFAKVVDANPGLRVVHVNLGRGGSINDALLLAEIIARRKMDTYVPRNCGGSCAIVVAGGVKRYLRDGARLGYANYDVPGKGPLDPAQWQSLYKTSFPPAFVAQATAASLQHSWVPSREELLAAGAVTEIVNGEKFAASGVATDAGSIEKDLLELRVFQVVKAREPAQFAALIEKLQAAVAKGMPVEQLRSVSLNWIGGLRAKYVPYADDTAVNAFIKLVRDEAESVAQKDVAACHAVLSGGAVPGAQRAIALMPKELRQREPEILADIFESADPARPLPDAARADALFDQVVAKMGADGALLDQASDPATSPEIGCRVSLSLYRALLTLPPADSAAVFKSWFMS